MRHPSRVLEVLPLVNGLFAHMDYTFWDFTSQELDILMQSRFGQRPVAPLIDVIQGPPLDPFAPRQKLSDAQLTQLASIILHTFRNKWDRLGAIHSLEYDVLKNYIDEYTEVLRDDTDASTLRETERADENNEVSRLSTTSGTEGEQANVSSNESTNRRSDDFNSEFARVSKDSQVRVDDLEESKVRSESTSEAKVDDFEESKVRSESTSEAKVDDLEESKVRSESTVVVKADESEEDYSKSVDSAQARTDNLTDATIGTGSNNKTISGGNYAENTQRNITSSGTENNASGLYGFNSDTPVGDSTSDTAASKTEAETIAKTITGQRTENVSLSDNTSVTHTGTQGTVANTDESGTKSISGTQSADTDVDEAYVKSNTGTQSTDTDVDEAYVKSNTGTQSTDTDVDEAYIKANKGSQNIEEDTSISDTTHTTDDQENTSIAHGSSSASNSSTSTTDSDSESSKSAVSRLNDSVIVNTALSRARESIHKGNIGNLTPQQLITQEIELWRWNFIDEVMSDIKSMITIPIYI